MSGLKSKNGQMMASNYSSTDYNKEALRNLDFEGMKKNPIYGMKYNFKLKKQQKNDGITITDINAVKYAHMNKSEFKKRKRKELKLNNFNKKFKMGQRKKSNAMLTSKISSTPRDRSLGNLKKNFRGNGGNIRRRLKVEEIIKKVNMEKRNDDSYQTRRNLFSGGQVKDNADSKKQPFIAKRFEGFVNVRESGQNGANRHFLQRNVNRPRAMSQNRLVKNMPSKAFETMQGTTLSSNKIGYHTGGLDSFNRFLNKGWESTKTTKVIDFTSSKLNKMPYKEKENIIKAYDFKKYRNPYADISDQKANREPQEDNRMGQTASNEETLDLLKVKQSNDFYQRSFEQQTEQEKVNIRESEIDVMNPLKSNYGSYYKIPFEVKKDKSPSKVKRRNGILKNRDHSTTRKNRSKSVKFKEEAEVNDNTTVRLKEDGEGKKPVPKK